VSSSSKARADDARGALRRRLLVERAQFAVSPAAPAAQAGLARHLRDVLLQLEPRCLGLYWPIHCEFNPRTALRDKAGLSSVKLVPQLALPYCRREQREMQYRVWDGGEPAARDECGIATSDGTATVPDVVVVPCLGFTREGLRLGYGGGYFDRWLAAHAHVTTVGVAWAIGLLDAPSFTAQAHDKALMMIVTEEGVVAS
jgi:5-formyltetrahydrofolate cyclo-ligase